MVAPSEVRSEIEKWFGTAITNGDRADPEYEAVLQDACRVSVLLADYDRMRAALQQLNAQLVREMGGARSDAVTYFQQSAAYYRDLKKFNGKPEKYRKEANRPQKPPKPSAVAGALARTFAVTELPAGFTLTRRGKSQVFTKFVDKHVFTRQNHLLQHWKDPSVTDVHGEYSHRIQWYCVLKGNAATNPALLFSFLGCLACPDRVGLTPLTLWDLVCDRDGGDASFVPFKAVRDHVQIGKAAYRTDFRSPELLNTFLKGAAGQQDDLEPLGSLLRQREVKRATVPIDADYIAQKLFGRPYRTLGAAEKGEVDHQNGLGAVY